MREKCSKQLALRLPVTLFTEVENEARQPADDGRFVRVCLRMRLLRGGLGSGWPHRGRRHEPRHAGAEGGARAVL